MYKNRKNILIVLLTIIIIFTGCVKNSDEHKPDAFAYSEQVVLKDWMKNPIKYVCIQDGIIYFSTFAAYVLEDGTEYTNNQMFSVNMDGSNLQEIVIDWSKEDSHAMIKDIWVADNHTISVWLSTYDAMENESVNVFLKVDSSGKELLRKDLNESVNAQNINDVLQTSQGNIIAMADYNIYVFNSDLELKGEVGSDCFLTGIVLSEDEKVICISEDKNYKKKLQTLDTNHVEWGQVISEKLDISMEDFSLMPNPDYDFCYRNDTGIYGYRINENDSFCILNYNKSNVSSNDICYVISESKEDFLILTENLENGFSNLVQYKKISNDNADEKVQITFGAFQFDEQMKRAVVEFNQNSTEYQIQMKEYFDEENGDTVDNAILKLNADIAKGDVPDILDFGLLSERYVSKGLFEDLTPYLQKDDVINEDDMIVSVLNALKQDDKLYIIAPNFRMATMIGGADYGQLSTEWNLEKFQKFCEEQESDSLPFYATSKMDVLDIFLQCGLSDYYDGMTGQCYFDSEEFESLLTFCNEIITSDEKEQTMRRDEMIEQGKLLWTDDDSFVPQKILEYQKLFGGEICYMGYPNREGQEYYFSFNNQIGITSASKVKDGAWEFIRMLLSEQYQQKNINVLQEETTGIPIRRDCFEQLMKELKKSEGNEKPTDATQQFLTEQQVKTFCSLVENTHKTIKYDIEMLKIIREEAQLYFEGERDIQSVMEAIQKRCMIYVNE
ncbi:MAG: extracellular solute-binding protein [Clostridium sp.]|nr:extracellular solute-binding protein [Clostridium sp.]